MTILNFLGFVDLQSTIWNLAAYLGMVIILFGVKSEKHRPHLIGAGGLILAVYAFFFLHDYILTSLQCLIAVSSVLEIIQVDKKISAIIISAISLVLLIVLVAGGFVGDAARWLGIGGVLGIAFGLVFAPNKAGFISMGLGGVLLVVYAPIVGAWVFFILNLIFAYLNFQTVIAMNKKQLA
ncbi:MAG: hypothetical protein Q7R75_01060 [bacterium]|nr:hypothetical protein [bacterium]